MFIGKKLLYGRDLLIGWLKAVEEGKLQMEKRVIYTEKEYKWELKSKKDRLFVQTTVFYLNIVMLF